MKFVDFTTGGAPAQMKLSETDMPSPLPNQILVKVAAFGINRADTLQRQGKYPPPAGESDILGLEMSGEIVSLGANVTQWKKGQAVFGLVAGGGYAEYVAVDEKHILPVPESITMPEAAGIAEVFLTAYQSLFLLGNLQPNQKVMIHAGASGVGLAATQLAKANNCLVAVTASSARKLKTCREYGADMLIDYTKQNFVDVIQSNWRNVDVILDFVGGDYLNRNLKIVNRDGYIVYLAMLAGRFADKLDMALLLGKRAKIIGSTLRNRSDEYKSELIASFYNKWFDALEKGILKPNIDSYYAARDMAIAHQRIEDNQTMGKLIGLWD